MINSGFTDLLIAEPGLLFSNVGVDGAGIKQHLGKKILIVLDACFRVL